MTLSNMQLVSAIVKTRRRHRKSRSGCFECKRRRIKCDESKPSCIRCNSLLEKCIYPPQSQKSIVGKLSMPTSSSSFESSATRVFSDSNHPSSAMSSHASIDGIDPCSIAAGIHEASSEADLYNHYLQCTSRSLTINKVDQVTLHTEMPKLASRSTTVLHALLAVSAVCLCHDLISKAFTPEVDAVNKVLLTGYRHYNLSIQQTRESMSMPTMDAEILLASAILLVPFATASQQINHWVSSNSQKCNPCKLLSTTPRDVSIIMRAIRRMLEIQRSATSSPNQKDNQEYDDSLSETIISFSSTPSRTHVMFPILTATIHPALVKLQRRLESASFDLDNGRGELLSACSTAFSVLKSIVDKVFSAPPNDGMSLYGPSKDRYYERTCTSLSHVAPWLRSYARKATRPLPTDPLTSLSLGFLIEVPQAYLDITIPLLDQRLESPVSAGTGAPKDNVTDLTVEQALALDIYAHWSVLMFLVEDESWWIGDLPIVTLGGMVNRYGDGFVGRLWPGIVGSEAWWPGSMLGISREVRRHR